MIGGVNLAIKVSRAWDVMRQDERGGSDGYSSNHPALGEGYCRQQVHTFSSLGSGCTAAQLNLPGQPRET